MVRVDAGVYALQDTISRIAPGAQVHAEAVNDSIILTGLVTSPAESDRIAQVAGRLTAATRAEHRPEQRVVGMSAGVVADGGLLVVGEVAQVREHALD